MNINMWKVEGERKEIYIVIVNIVLFFLVKFEFVFFVKISKIYWRFVGLKWVLNMGNNV